MKKRVGICVFISLCSISQYAFSQNVEKFVSSRAIKLDLSDNPAEIFGLASLDSLIKDDSIVMIGENRHGDGTSQREKIRIIKYLHEKKGFDVLLTE
jgi:erythromycin esterase